MAVDLPLYSPSSPAPTYCPHPLPDEQRLQHNPSPRTTPSGTWTKETRSSTLVLVEQDDKATHPTYGRNATIIGEIHLHDREVQAVAIHLDGHYSLEIADGGTIKKSTLSEKYTLWKNDHSSDLCPAVIPFSCAMPATYKDGDRTRPLPPTYHISFPDVPGMIVESTYSFSVVITKSRRLALWKRRNSISVCFMYHPRTRPHRPIIHPQNTFLSDVKMSPDEWHQISSLMPSRPSSGVQPIQCHLFIPSVQIYALSDTIPFHLQISAPLPSIQAFFPCTPSDSDPSFSTSHFCSSTPSERQPTVRIFLLRQITVEIRGQKAWRNCILGEGKLRPLPPTMTCRGPSERSPEDGTETTLDWEGEVRCNDDIIIGSFSLGQSVVKDFIVLALDPHNPESSPLIAHQHAHSIRLVTDPWIDDLPASMRA